MRKLKLLFTGLAFLGGVFSANAQVSWTDKTSLITNPSFETDEAISDLKGCGWATDRVTGWTIAPSSPGSAQVGVGNSSSTIQGIASSFSPSDGDNYFYMRENWNPNTTFSISQIIADGSIPAGIYRLTVKAAMFSSVASTYTLSLQEEGQAAATNTKSYAGTANNESWSDWSVMVIKRADDTDLTITAAYKTPGENSKEKHYSLLLDDVKLEYLAPTSVSSTNTFDMTSWIVNPSFELNTFNGTLADGSSLGNSGGTINKPTGFTCYFNVSGWRDCNSNTTAPADGTYCMNSWFGTINEQKFYQTIDYLPEGVYEISAQVRTDQTSTDGIYTYGIAGGNTYKSASWDASKKADTWNSMENWQTLTARASIIGGGSLQFGLRSDKFIQFDDFHLTYLGSDLLLDGLKDEFAKLQATATDDLENAIYNNINGSERTDLTNAKNATPDETVAAWNNAIITLTNAISAFEAAKTNYDALVAEIAKAKALGIDDATADGYAATSSSTAASALISTQNLKVAEYNYVTTNYQHGVALGEWTSTGTNTSAATFSNEHWSGETHEYKNQNDNNNQGWNAQSWSIDFSQEVPLPAGNYVFKVAGRQASGDAVNTSLVVTNKSDDSVLGTVSDFPRSNKALGINKEGATSFDPEDPAGFANDGNGFGWEWRYVKFTLASDATVIIAVNAVATDWHQWVSFGDYTLQTDNEANISLIEYNVALASAQTTIADDTYKNVTGSEKTDLQAAIDADASLDKTDKDAIDAAKDDLETATDVFTGAKAAYDAYVDAKAVVYENNLPYASSTKFEAIATAQGAADATSASDAEEKTAAIISAYRKYVESNALAEGVVGAENKTSLISDPDMDVTYDGTTHTFGAWQVFSQVDGIISLKTESDQPLTDGDGNKYKYADIWKSDNNAGIKQTLNLPAGKYLLTAAARAQDADGATYGLFAGSARTEIPRISSTGGQFGNGWNDAYVVFGVRETSDVEIGVQSGNGKSMWWGATRFRLALLPTPDVTISEAATVAPTAEVLANVTLTRTLSSEYWNTFSVPFDMTIPDGWTVKEFDNAVGNEIYFKDAATIKAGEPYLVKPNENVENPPYENVVVMSTEGNSKGSGGYKFAAQIYNKPLATDGTIAYLSTDGTIKKLTSGGIKGLRAYFIIPAGSEGARISFGGEETGIQFVETQNVSNNAIYDMQGRKVNNMKKGVYVVNGKKVIK